MNANYPEPGQDVSSEQDASPSGTVHLAPLLAIAANRFSRSASSFYRKHFGIGVVELRIVLALGRRDQQNANELRATTDLDRGAVSRSARVLEEMGWIRIVNTGKAAPRLLMSLTDLGREKYRMLSVLAADREERVLADFSEEEIATLRSLLRRLISATSKS